MTDNEIIKALEWCGCSECIAIRDLINRQKAEIERLGELLRLEAEGANTLNDVIAEQQAEIERLQNDYLSMQSTLAKMMIGIEQARTEAIKEFAERLKANYSVFHAYKGGLIKLEIDNLVKEMTEDQK